MPAQKSGDQAGQREIELRYFEKESNDFSFNFCWILYTFWDCFTGYTFLLEALSLSFTLLQYLNPFRHGSYINTITVFVCWGAKRSQAKNVCCKEKILGVGWGREKMCVCVCVQLLSRHGMKEEMVVCACWRVYFWLLPESRKMMRRSFLIPFAVWV